MKFDVSFRFYDPLCISKYKQCTVFPVNTTNHYRRANVCLCVFFQLDNNIDLKVLIIGYLAKKFETSRLLFNSLV